jgi:3-oxoacyl-[acyl-carrier protein] reductase
MNVSLAGTRAIVCGSSQGIGKAAAIELASLGATVVLLARDAAKLGAVQQQLSAAAGQKHSHIAVDFANLAAVEQAARQLASDTKTHTGHILINNAGGPPGGPILAATPADFEAAFRSHVLASHILTQAIVPSMKAAKHGRIINIISTSVKAPIAGLGISNTIRGAMASWAKTMANELGPFGITVNNVLPGFTKTDRLSSLVKAKATKAATSEDMVSAEMLATIPAGRFADPEETAAAIAFLASPAAAYISGTNLPVDGGRLPVL